MPNNDILRKMYKNGSLVSVVNMTQEGMTVPSNIETWTLNDYGQPTSIELKSSVTIIDTHAFSGCNMQYAEVLATTPPSLPGTYTFTGTYQIYVPDASVNAYKSNSDWSQYSSRIKPISEKP